MRLDDVDLPAGADDRVDRLVASTSFTTAQAEAIVRFSCVDEDDRDDDLLTDYLSTGDGADVEDGLTSDDCSRIRRDMAKASRPTTVIDRYPDKHPSVIFRPATGRCGHDAGVDPTTSPRIQSDECREMRVAFQTGDDVEDIRDDYNRSANAVVKHVFGRCDHTFEHDRNGRELADGVCNRMRRAYRENSTASVADIGRAFIVGTSTAHRHLVGDCRHRNVEEAPVDPQGPTPIDEAECQLIRAAYFDDTVPDALANAFDRDVTSIRRHLFGRCDHGDSGERPDRDSVGAERCREIRMEYRTRGVESVSSVIDRLGVSKGSFYYHLKGRCGHDVDADPVDG